MHRVIEFALAVTIMVFFSGSNFYFVFLGINPDIAPDELAQFDGVIVKFFLLCYVLIAIMTVCFWQSALKGMIVLWPFGVVVAMAWLSLAWSIDPSVTSRRSLALTVTYLYALVLFARFDFDEILKILISGLGIIMLGPLVAVVALPEFAVHGDGDHAGAWRGLFAQKNAAGRTMIWLMIAIIAAWLTGRIHRGMLAIVGSLTLLFIAATTSKTALLGLTAALMVGPLIVTARKKTLTSALIVFAMLSVTLIVTVVVSFTYEDILLSMGRDPTPAAPRFGDSLSIFCSSAG